MNIIQKLSRENIETEIIASSERKSEQQYNSGNFSYRRDRVFASQNPERRRPVYQTRHFLMFRLIAFFLFFSRTNIPLIPLICYGDADTEPQFTTAANYLFTRARFSGFCNEYACDSVSISESVRFIVVITIERRRVD